MTCHPLKPSTALHRSTDVQYLSRRTIPTHEVPGVDALVGSLKDLEGEVMRTAEWKEAGGRQEKGVVRRLWKGNIRR